MIIQDNGIIWGEEKDRKDELIFWLIYECSGRSAADCCECHFKKICREHKQDIESRWSEIYSNLQEYDKIHKKMEMEKR